MSFLHKSNDDKLLISKLKIENSSLHFFNNYMTIQINELTKKNNDLEKNNTILNKKIKLFENNNNKYTQTIISDKDYEYEFI